MRTLSATEVLEVWEDGSQKALAERALELLAVGYPEVPRERLESLTVGQRDAMLLALRQSMFGSALEAVVICPACGERLDLAFDLREIQSLPEAEGDLSLEVAGYDLRFRPANAGDAVAASGAGDLEGSRKVLLQRCLLSANREGTAIDSKRIPPDVTEAVWQRLAEADPMADIRLAVGCPKCDHRWSATLDIVSFLWKEIGAWAWRTLSDVHTLASAYGWSEQEILALSPKRRQCYLRMVWA